MISKLLYYGKDRDQAISRMKRALNEYRISGVTTNIEFHKTVLDHPEFIAGRLSTHFIDDHFDAADEPLQKTEETLAVAAAMVEHNARNKLSVSSVKKTPLSAWKTSWRPGNSEPDDL